MLRGSVRSVESHQEHTFSRAPQAGIPRSKFNRSHGVKTTFNEGLLVPVLIDEMLPGDTFNLSMQAFCRMSTPIFPIMDNLYLESFFFSVPYRLVWDNWEKFNGYQVNPGDSTNYTIPQLASPSGGYVSQSLGDYFGLPVGNFTFTTSSLPFRAYNLIWNEWFRDENLQNSLTVRTTDTGDVPGDYNVVRRGKRYDYFTSCLPFPQKGPDVTLPLGVSAPVIPDGNKQPLFNVTGSSLVTSLYGQTSDARAYISQNSPLPNAPLAWDTTALATDLSSATAATINQIRQAFQTQKMYERDARGGTRYTEIIKSHFGVVSPDMRLQRPEYIGGGTSPIIVNPVAQTSHATTVSRSDGLGVLGAYGVCPVSGHGFTYSATEHCLLIGLVSVRADLNYQQGLERMWSRRTRFDFYWPALSHLGEQAVLNKEIYLQGTRADEDVFGYQERYAEYRYKPSQITGIFRSTADTGTLEAWHLAQKFGSLPTLSDTFIQENAPMGRILAVPDEPHFLLDCFFDYKCARPMPVYAIPGLVDHF